MTVFNLSGIGKNFQEHAGAGISNMQQGARSEQAGGGIPQLLMGVLQTVMSPVTAAVDTAWTQPAADQLAKINPGQRSRAFDEMAADTMALGVGAFGGGAAVSAARRPGGVVLPKGPAATQAGVGLGARGILTQAKKENLALVDASRYQPTTKATEFLEEVGATINPDGAPEVQLEMGKKVLRDSTVTKNLIEKDYFDEDQLWKDHRVFYGKDREGNPTFNMELADDYRYVQIPKTPDITKARGTYNLGDIYKHPELFKAFPEFSDMKVTIKKFDEQQKFVHGKFILPNSEHPVGKIELNTSGVWPGTERRVTDMDMMDSLFHELNHGFQEHQYLASGGNTKAIRELISVGEEAFYITAKDVDSYKALMKDFNNNPQRKMLLDFKQTDEYKAYLKRKTKQERRTGVHTNSTRRWRARDPVGVKLAQLEAYARDYAAFREPKNPLNWASMTSLDDIEFTFYKMLHGENAGRTAGYRGTAGIKNPGVMEHRPNSPEGGPPIDNYPNAQTLVVVKIPGKNKQMKTGSPGPRIYPRPGR